MAGWAFYVPRIEVEDEGRSILKIKVSFSGTILVDGRLDSDSAYKAESVGILTVTIFLHFL